MTDDHDLQSRAPLGGALAPGSAGTPGRSSATAHMPASARSIARALVAEMRVQASGALDGADVHATAAAGTSGTGGALPYLDQIQRAFGHHDVSGVRAHVGGAAAEASAAIGARAYATGDDVAFAAAPDLHLAAHEATHVVQQRGGVRLSGGVGRAGDTYEQHADAVADAVVRGDSAQSLLDPFAHRGPAGGSAVQLLVDESGAAALATARRTLAHADRATLDAVVRQLDTQVATDPVTIEYADSADQYRLHMPHAQAQQLRGECQRWRAGAPAGAPVMTVPGIDRGADADREREAAQSAQSAAERQTLRRLPPTRGSIASFMGDALAGAIAAAAGEVGEEREIEIMTRIPIWEALTVDGGMMVKVAHEEDGFALTTRPRLGLGVAGGPAHGHAELLTELEFSTRGETPERAATQLATEIEVAIRRTATRPPPMFVCLLLGTTAAGPVILAADAATRVYNYYTTGRASDPFWIWLADSLFGAGHADRVIAELREHEFMEITDGVLVAGGASQGEGRDRAGVEGELGASEHWRAEGGEDGPTDLEFGTLDFRFALTLPRGISGEASGRVPFSQPGRGQIELQLSGHVETHSLAQILGADVLSRVLQQVIEYMSPHHEVEEARAEVSRAMRAVGSISSGATSAVESVLGAAAGAEIGLQVHWEFPLGNHEPFQFTLSSTSGVSHEEGSTLEFSAERARELWSYHGGAASGGA